MRSKRGSYSSPRGSRRACLCKDGRTYSRKCCDGELINQGIGPLSGGGIFADEDFSCSDLTLSGFSVSDQGVITIPTTNAGTIQSTSPSNFDLVGVDTSRTLSVVIIVPSGYTNTGSTITCTTTATQPAASTLSCSDITLSGFEVAQNGTITLPSTNIGTISSTSPASFAIVDVSTVRTLNVDITVPAEYFNAGATLNCTTTATQPLSPTLSCADITLSGFAVASDGIITVPTTDIGTISGTSPASFTPVSTETLRTLTVDVTVPSGYFNEGNTLSCTTTATQPPQRNFLFSDIVFTTVFSVSQAGQQDDDQANPGLAHITAPIAQYAGNSLSMTVVYTGSVTSTGQPGTIFGLEYYDLVTAPTSRSCTISVTVPAGFLNVGQIISGNQNTEQQPCTKTYDIDTQQSTTYTTYSVGDGFGNTYEIRGIKGIDNISSTFYSTSTPTVVSGRTDSPTYTKDASSYDSSCRHGLLGKTNRSGSYLGPSGTDTPQSVTYYISAYNSDDTLITVPEVGMGIYKASGVSTGEFGVDFTYTDLYQPDGYYTHIGYTFVVTSGVITSITSTP